MTLPWRIYLEHRYSQNINTGKGNKIHEKKLEKISHWARVVVLKKIKLFLKVFFCEVLKKVLQKPVIRFLG